MMAVMKASLQVISSEKHGIKFFISSVSPASSVGNNCQQGRSSMFWIRQSLSVKKIIKMERITKVSDYESFLKNGNVILIVNVFT